MKRLLAALTLSVSAAACAPVVQGGPPMDLPPGLAETARVSSVVLSSEWLDAEDDFAETFSEEVMEELDMCAYGTYPVQVRVHVEDLERADRLAVLLRGDGEHRLRAVAELVDPARQGQILGRYPIEVSVGAGGRIAGLAGDRQMIVSEAFGRALCDAAFARNPRRPGLHNATGG
ncbi:MAG: hypothetical protein DCF29_14565 [Alphaproteobacteria bacterium]|nr:MAG: hypothetical protein DCF29_14565 [Alphaproteobacteria bacterium]